MTGDDPESLPTLKAVIQQEAERINSVDYRSALFLQTSPARGEPPQFPPANTQKKQRLEIILPYEPQTLTLLARDKKGFVPVGILVLQYGEGLEEGEPYLCEQAWSETGIHMKVAMVLKKNNKVYLTTEVILEDLKPGNDPPALPEKHL